MSDAIRTEQLSKRYGETLALDVAYRDVLVARFQLDTNTSRSPSCGRRSAGCSRFALVPAEALAVGPAV
jgi:hypothetical protein